MYALSSRSRGAAGLSLRSSQLANAAAAVIEPLERRALLSAGDVLSTAITDVQNHSDTGGAVVRLADQKLLEVGLSFDASFTSVFSLARFNADGSPDGTFGVAGSNIVTSSLPDPAYSIGAVNAVTVDANSGRIIVVGRIDSASGADFLVAAFTSDGHLDGGFGSGGVAINDFTPGRTNEARAVAIDGNTIIVAGSDLLTDEVFAVARYNSDGTLDDAFGNHGVAETPFVLAADGTNSRDMVHAIAIDQNGNIILAGSSQADFNGEMAPVIAVQRYTAEGTLDATFGVGGNVRFDVPAPALTALGDKAYSVAVDEQGRILIGGTTDGPIGSSDDFVLLRFTADGNLDADFNADAEPGVVRTYFGGFSSGLISDIAVQSDGAIVTGGNVLFCNDDSCGEGFNSFAVARYDASGQLDSNFGTGTLPGVVLTQHFQVNFQGIRPEMNLATVALQSDANHNHFIALGSWIPNDFFDNDPLSDDLVLVQFALSGLSVKLAGPTIANEGDTVHFTANFSGALAEGISFSQAQHRAEGTAAPRPTITYDWSITIDGAVDPVATGSGTGTDTLDIPFTPADNGIYHFNISINDGAASASADITVNNVNPTAAILLAPESSPEGTSISLGSNVSDPATADTFTYAWSVTKNGAPFAAGTESTFSFTPDDNGSYAVTLTVTDDDGGVGSDSRTIDVSNVVPTATINDAPASGLEGSTISLNRTVSDPGSADTFSYAWSVTKNGAAFASGSDATFSFTPDDNGSYAVTLTVTDDDGGVGSDSRTIAINNVDPTASINGAPTSSAEGTGITLTSSVSDPGSADTFSYAWSVTKNGSTYASGSDSTFSFKPDDNGSYVVSLMVTDDDGGSGVASSTIAVTNVAPTAAINGAPASSAEGSGISLTSSASDPGSADTFTYAWSVTKNGNAFASGSAATFSFTPNDNGTYVVTLRVTDDDGGVGADSKSITVTNVAPTATINGAPASGSEGTGISVSSSVSDPGSADTFTFAWAVTKNGSAYASGSASNFSFTPNDNGTYLLTLTVTDNNGGVGSDSRTIVINNVAPSVSSISAPSAGQQGAPQNFSSAFSDPGSADTWTVTWNFGDGTSLTTAGSPGPITASHTYVAAGTYTVSVTVSDDDGGSGSQSSSISISNSNTGLLQIQGTAGDDQITVKPGCDGTLLVIVNGVQTTHSGITQIVITAGAGDDKVKINPEVTQSTIVFGGDGDDSIKTGAGDDIVIGGNGDDLLHGNDGRDLIIGGWGNDRIVGNSDSDILVAGWSKYDADPAALGAILAEWTSARSYGQRTANVMGRDVIVAGVHYTFGGPRNNGNTFLAPDGANATVFDDGQVDILTGNAQQDLFLFNSDCGVTDILTGLSANELAVDIDFLSEV